MPRYLRNAIAYCVIGILLLIIGIIWLNLNEKTVQTGLSMLCSGICFELVAIYFFIRHKKEES